MADIFAYNDLPEVLMHPRIRPYALTLSILLLSAAALATTPTVTVASPANNATTTSPVNYVATAVSPDCAEGISTIEIYSAPHVVAYFSVGGSMDAYVNLPAGTYNTVVEAFDNCGGVGEADITVTTTGESQIGGFLYTANTNFIYGDGGRNAVYGFTIVPSNGALAPTGQGAVDANEAPQSIASDKGGYRLYVGDYYSGDVFAYFIDRDNGYIFPVPGAPFPVNHSVTAVAVHPSGDWVFATRDENAAGDGIAVFAVQSNGSLVEAAGSPYSTQPGPYTMVMDPGGQYLYVATTDYPGTNQYSYVDGFSFSASTGTLTPLPGSPFAFPIPSACSDKSSLTLFQMGMLDDLGKYLYVGQTDLDYIEGMTIDSATGAPTEMKNSPWPDEDGCVQPPDCTDCANNPTSLAVDGTGKFLYTLNQGASNIGIYSIGSGGALTFVKYEEIGQVCYGTLGTDSTGSYLYAGTCQGIPQVYSGFEAVSGFSINHITGDLTPTPGSPYNYELSFFPNGLTIVQALTVTP